MAAQKIYLRGGIRKIEVVQFTYVFGKDKLLFLQYLHLFAVMKPLKFHVQDVKVTRFFVFFAKFS
jgi:hypothetical protein